MPQIGRDLQFRGPDSGRRGAPGIPRGLHSGPAGAEPSRRSGLTACRASSERTVLGAALLGAPDATERGTPSSGELADVMRALDLSIAEDRTAPVDSSTPAYPKG